MFYVMLLLLYKIYPFFNVPFRGDYVKISVTLCKKFQVKYKCLFVFVYILGLILYVTMIREDLWQGKMYYLFAPLCEGYFTLRKKLSRYDTVTILFGFIVILCYRYIKINVTLCKNVTLSIYYFRIVRYFENFFMQY